MKRILDIILRYCLLIIVAIPNLFIFYWIFTPWTIYVSYLIFKIFTDASLYGAIIFINNVPIVLIKACIAGSAYYLLLILNLSLPNIKLAKRIRMIVFSFSIFFFLNVFRIVILGLLFLNNSYFFDITHKLFWYVLSTLFVVGIWMLEVKLFKLKGIPFYSDFKFLYDQSTQNSKNTKSSKKH